MTRSLNVSPKTTEQHLIVRSDKSVAYVTNNKQEVKVIWQKALHGGPIPWLGVTPVGRKLYHWIPGVGFAISVP